MDSEKTVTSIRWNNDSVVFLVLEWEKDKKLSLKILNIEEKEAYEGQATEFDLRSQAAKIRMSFSDFMLKTRDALFKSSSGEINYLYSLENSNENYVFKWKSIDSEETIISLGSLEVEKINFYSFLTQFLFSFSDEMQSMKLSIENLNSELNACKDQLSTALTNLSSAIDLKKGLEKELYSKFILLLNEKKCKIKELERSPNISSPTIKKKKMPPSKMIAFSDESDTGKNLNISVPLIKKKTIPPSKMIAFSDESDTEENHSISSPLIKKKKMPLVKMLASSDEFDTGKNRNISVPLIKKKTIPPSKMIAFSDESDTEENHSISSPLIKKKKMPLTKMLASSDKSDKELENNSNTSSRLNMKKENPPTNTVASYESNLKIDNTSNTSLQLNKKKKNHFLNMLVSSSESDVDGDFQNEEPGPSNQRLNNSLQFDDEPPLPQTQIRKRKVAQQKNSLPVPSSHSADKDNFSDDGSVDSLIKLL